MLNTILSDCYSTAVYKESKKCSNFTASPPPSAAVVGQYSKIGGITFGTTILQVLHSNFFHC